MSKFIKRIGTSASKFMIEMSIQKVELNLIQTCRISIILKRGDHTLETKAAVALEKGVAKFDEKIVIPATLYYETKKKVYMKKEASVSINVITPKVTRLAGATKIDLSYYPNNNITEQDVVQNIDKCFDKNAKLYFKLRMVKVSDILPERKSRKDKDKKSKKPGQESGNESESKDHSGSPLPSRIDGTDMHDYSDNSSIPDLSKYDGSKSQTGVFGFGKGKGSDFGIEDHSDGELDNKLRSRTVDALKLGRSSISEGGKGVKNKFFDTPSEMTVNDSMSQGPTGNKLLELEVKVKNYQKENKELYNKIREDNEEYLNLNQEYEDLKLKHERLQKNYDNVLSDKHVDASSSMNLGKKNEFEVKIYKDKVAELEKEIKEIKQERDEANERADELQQATQDLLAKIETYKNKDKKNYKDNGSDNVEEYIVKVNDLNQKLKESEKKIKELTDSQKNGKNKSMLSNDDISDIENSSLKRKIEEKDSRIEELERQMGIQANELQLMKKMNSSIRNKEDNSQQFVAQLETMEKKQKGLEDTYKKRIEELTKQNTEIKRELEQAKNASSSSQFDTENELAKLSIENESLKRQVKDLNGRILNVKYDNKDVEEIRRRLTQVETEKDRLDAELVKAKMGWASADMERDDAKSKLKSKEENTKGQQERMEIMEKEVFRLRSRIAELMNAVMEFGEMELLDQIEAIITQGDQENDPNQEQINWRKTRY